MLGGIPENNVNENVHARSEHNPKQTCLIFQRSVDGNRDSTTRKNTRKTSTFRVKAFVEKFRVAWIGKIHVLLY
jgi:hypothetical protein